MTTTRHQKFRIGLFAVISGALLALVIVVFGGVHLWQSRSHYTIVFDDSVGGLANGSEVSFNGIKVGSVKAIAIDKVDVRKVRVEITVDDDTPVRSDTLAMLNMGGLTGSKSIDLRGGASTAPRMPEGGQIAVGETMLDKLERQAKTMVDQSTELLTHANKIVTKAERIVENLGELTDPAKLGDIMAQTRATATNLAQASASLNAMIGENRVALRSSLKSIDLAAQSATQLLDGQVAGVVAGFGDVIAQVKAVVHDDGAQLHSAMADIKQASRSFKELASEVRQKPSRLLFSNSEPDRKLP